MNAALSAMDWEACCRCWEGSMLATRRRGGGGKEEEGKSRKISHERHVVPSHPPHRICGRTSQSTTTDVSCKI
eukprot:134079-Hanusia_phi.AAC.1